MNAGKDDIYGTYRNFSEHCFACNRPNPGIQDSEERSAYSAFGCSACVNFILLWVYWILI